MSRRKLLMRRKITEAVRAGHAASVVMPKNLKRKSLKRLFEAAEKV